MKSESMNELKEWWNACPSKGLHVLTSIIMIFFGLNCAYELGVGLGTFIYHVMH